MVGFASLTSAQNFQGHIEYGMTYENLPPEMAGMESMLPSASDFYLKDDMIRFEQDIKDEKGFMLMDMMGQKLKLDISPESLGEEAGDDVDPEITYSKETKNIAGYKCKKAIVTIPADGETPAISNEVWYTDKIQGGHNQFKTLKGFPLEYVTDMNGMTVTVTAKNVSKENVSKSMFEHV